MEELDALRNFAGEDEARAREAYACLCRRARPVLLRYLRRSLPSAADCEDAIQETFCRIWSFRSRFRDQGIAAWNSMLIRTARRCLLDARRAGTELPLDDNETADEGAPEHAVLRLELGITEVEALYAHANVLWLELDERLPPETHDRQLLAAQLFYLDGEPWDRVLRLLGGAPGEPLTRAMLDEWLRHPGVLRYLFFHSVYLDRDELAAYLLGVEEPISEGLDALARRAAAEEPESAPPEGWTWDETAALLWRYRHALLASQIVARRDCRLSRGELERLFDRSRAAFPFNSIIKHLLARCRGAGDALDAVGTAGLWQRLAFQYAYHDELPHRDIHERTAPAAAEVGYSLTPGMLNVWLSNGRLLERLVRFCERRGLVNHE